jgi:hypothetical protein
MLARWAIVVGITLGCGGDKATPTPTAGSSELTSPKVPIAAPQQPQLGSVAPQTSADATFTAEQRDGDWAEPTELGIRERFKRVRGAKLEATECRQSQCRLVLAGSTGDLQQAIADLEGSRGLHGFAKNVLLTAPEKKADGTLVMRAFATFDR